MRDLKYDDLADPILIIDIIKTPSRGLLISGRKDGIRTHGLLVPNQAHYQAVLLPDIRNQITIIDQIH